MTNPDDPLLAGWEATLAKQGAAPAIFKPSGQVLATFREIEDASRALELDQLKDFGRGDVIALQIGNHARWPSLLLGCLRRGIIVLPLEQTMSAPERDVALKTCAVTGLMTSPGKIQRLTKSQSIDWQGLPPTLLKLTSGTTAAPRAIRFRSAQLLADAEQICDTMGITAGDLNFGVIPWSHSYGFSNLITPLLVRGVPLVQSSDRMPRAVLNDLAHTNATVFPGMPLFYQAFIGMEDVPAMPHLRLCISAGAPLAQNVAQRFREKFGRAIHSFYGASECGGICYDRAAAPNEPDGYVGPPMSGVTVESLGDESGAGQICVHSAATGDGYFPEPEPEKLGDGKFVPDDLVEIYGNGFRLAGRLSDVINVAGKKVNPAEVEAHLLSHPRVRQAVVFGRASLSRNQEVVACVVAEPKTAEAALLEFCRTRLSGWRAPKRIFLLDALPANERGKVSRRELGERFSFHKDGG